MRERAHAFVFPSLHDDAPWVVGEALAHGVPIVCLDRGGTPIVAGGPGVPVGSINEMAAGLAKALAETRLTAPSTSWDIDTRHADLLSVLRKSNLLPRARDVTPSPDEGDP
jgi:glycosyltransferase involved in cell wall biosynthesis